MKSVFHGHDDDSFDDWLFGFIQAVLGSFYEAIMVTDLFMIETKAKLAASDKYHETALELGLVRCHIQGFRKEKYEDTVEALNRIIKEQTGSDGDNGNTAMVMFLNTWRRTTMSTTGTNMSKKDS